MELAANQMIMVNGAPVQLLYLINKKRGVEAWKVRPLFVEEPDRPAVLSARRTYKKIHVRPIGWRHAATVSNGG